MIQFKWIDATGNLVNCWVGCCGGTLLIADDISQIARFDMDPSNVSFEGMIDCKILLRERESDR